MKSLTLIMYICLLFAPQISQGSMDRPKTVEDFALLPPFCRAHVHAGYPNINQAEATLWAQRLGLGWPHVHHYCFGLFDTTKNKPGAAIAEMDYVMKHSPPFPLMPRISYDMGKLYEQIGDPNSAMQAYFKSIKLNPKLPMPYAALSDLFKKQNNNKDAIAILQQGLKFKPNSKALLKRLEKLNK